VDKALAYFHCLRHDLECSVWNYGHKFPDGLQGHELARIGTITTDDASGSGSGGGKRGGCSRGGDAASMLLTPGSAGLVDSAGYASVAASLSSEPLLPPVSVSQARELVMQFLTNYFAQESNNKFDAGQAHKYFSESYLRWALARAKLGMERSWDMSSAATKDSKLHASLVGNMSPEAMQSFAAERVLRFGPVLPATAATAAGVRGNALFYADPTGRVSVEIVAKNAGKLSVAVFPVQTRSFLLSQVSSAGPGDRADDDPSKIGLDGLVSNHTLAVDLSAVPSRQTVQRRIELPMLTNRRRRR
jgi:hypothetical protein